jgi:hypothetical protein
MGPDVDDPRVVVVHASRHEEATIGTEGHLIEVLGRNRDRITEPSEGSAVEELHEPIARVQRQHAPVGTEGRARRASENVATAGSTDGQRRDASEVGEAHDDRGVVELVLRVSDRYVPFSRAPRLR